MMRRDIIKALHKNWKCYEILEMNFIMFVFVITPQPLYNTIVGVQYNFHVSYPIRVIMTVKYINVDIKQK